MYKNKHISNKPIYTHPIVICKNAVLEIRKYQHSHSCLLDLYKKNTRIRKSLQQKQKQTQIGRKYQSKNIKTLKNINQFKEYNLFTKKHRFKDIKIYHRNQLILDNIVGQGFYGDVYKAFSVTQGIYIAVKQIKNVNRDKDFKQLIINEIKLLTKLNHPNIVEFNNYEQINNDIYMYMQLVQAGSLKNVISQFGLFEEEQVVNITFQILKALEYLHKNYVIHRDIKAANILTDYQGHIKLCDFGSAVSYMYKKVEQESDNFLSVKGSFYWMAPQLINNIHNHNQKKYGRRVDIWSLGCTVIQLLSGQHPWQDCQSMTQLMIRIQTQKMPKLQIKISNNLQKFIKKCLIYQANKRPYAWQLLKDPLFQKLIIF